MSKKKILVGIFLLVLILAVSCTSKDEVTGKTAAQEPDIYEEAVQAEGQNASQINVTQEVEQNLSVQINETLINETEESLPNETQENITQEANATVNETNLIEQPKEEEKFKFSPKSIVSKQNNVSISIDDIKYEIKTEYWGKITGITTTLFNEGNKSFKPKVIVLLYDEEDFKEEWFKSKAEIEFDIEKLNPGEHITKDAIVSISFDDINLTKKFRLILIDAADPGNKLVVAVEEDFKPLQNLI